MVKRSILALSAAALVVAAIAAYVVFYLTNVPGSARAAQTSAGAQLYLATVPAAEATDPHSSWVSYYVTNSHDANWQHKTTLVVPANTLVHVTIFQYDGDSGLRNPFISQATGTVGGTFTLNGKTVNSINPDTASHIFAIPELGVSVPLQGVADDAKNACGNADCTLSQAHQTITFTFKTGARGLYRWQCYVPCAAGYVDGFGGPMQTVGYMDGFLKVV
jgi:hypothetical protein